MVFAKILKCIPIVLCLILGMHFRNVIIRFDRCFFEFDLS